MTSATVQCLGKQRHSTQADALRHRRNLRRRNGGKVSAYHCPHCGGWHVGSKIGERS